MKDEQEYIKDIATIRTIMERTTKFKLLSGWAGIMAGIYALAGVVIVHQYFRFNPGETEDMYISGGPIAMNTLNVIILAKTILLLSVGTAIYLSNRKAKQTGEKLWNATTKRLLLDMAIPLLAGGFLMLTLLSKGYFGLMAPLSLIFYGLALYNAGKFTYDELKILGFIQIGLGLISSYFVQYGLLFWALGFGLAHILYGTYLHYKYER